LEQLLIAFRPPLSTWMIWNMSSIRWSHTAAEQPALITVTETLIECGSSSSIEPASAKSTGSTFSFSRVAFDHMICFSRVVEAAEGMLDSWFCLIVLIKMAKLTAAVH
jgi:hypothetical protein